MIQKLKNSDPVIGNLEVPARGTAEFGVGVPGATAQ